MDLGLKPGDYGYKASQNKIQHKVQNSPQPSETSPKKEEKPSLESRVEKLEAVVELLTESLKVLAQAGQNTARIANRARVSTQRYGG